MVPALSLIGDPRIVLPNPDSATAWTAESTNVTQAERTVVRDGVSYIQNVTRTTYTRTSTT